MKPRRLLRLLERELGYRQVSIEGSHRKLVCPGRPTLIISFHDREEVSSVAVRAILIKQAGLSLDAAKEVVRHA